jgi:hypothetical protein
VYGSTNRVYGKPPAKRTVFVIVVGLTLAWLVGVGTGFAAVAATGGWYTYHVAGAQFREEMAIGCEPFTLTGVGGFLLRCPRFQVPVSVGRP